MLSYEAKQIIFGSVLGDGYYHPTSKNFKFMHTDAQYEYLMWKYSKTGADSKVTKYVYSLDKTNYSDKETITYQFTIKRADMAELEDYFTNVVYRDGAKHKHIDRDFLDQLDSLGLMVWFFDDGVLSNTYKSTRYIRISSNAFDMDTHLLMQEYFNDKYGIKVKITQNRGYNCLYLNAYASQQFISLFYKYAFEIPSMTYKIDMRYTDDNMPYIRKHNPTFIPVHEEIKNYRDSLTTAGHIQ